MDNRTAVEKRHITPKTLVVYIICALVLVFYLCVLFAPRDVCLEYEMYYVEKTLDDWPGYGGLKYELGNPVYFGSDRKNANSLRRGKGWSTREKEYCWTVANEANVYFCIDPEISGSIQLNILVGEKDCAQYDLVVNGRLIKGSLVDAYTTVTAEIPADAVGDDGLICVTIRSNDPGGLQVMEMSLTEVV